MNSRRGHGRHEADIQSGSEARRIKEHDLCLTEQARSGPKKALPDLTFGISLFDISHAKFLDFTSNGHWEGIDHANARGHFLM